MKAIGPALITLTAALLAGCAPALEQFERQQAPEALSLPPQAAMASDGWAVTTVDGLRVQTRWTGTARPLVTAFDWIGRVSRFVVPYTRRTWLVEVRVTNAGGAARTIRARDWQMTAEPGAVRRDPLGLPFFKEQWPTEAVRMESMMLDQALAIGHVIRTLWEDRTIDPGETATGVLPFLAGIEAPTGVRLEWKTSPVPATFRFGEGS